MLIGCKYILLQLMMRLVPSHVPLYANLLKSLTRDIKIQVWRLQCRKCFISSELAVRHSNVLSFEFNEFCWVNASWIFLNYLRNFCSYQTLIDRLILSFVVLLILSLLLHLFKIEVFWFNMFLFITTTIPVSFHLINNK